MHLWTSHCTSVQSRQRKRRGSSSGRRSGLSRRGRSHAAARQVAVAGGGDCTRRHLAPARRRPTGARATLQRVALGHPARERSRVIGRADPARPPRTLPPTLGKLDPLPLPTTREASCRPLPLALNSVGAWRTLDTSSVARCFPFSATRPRHALPARSTAIDLRASAPVVYDPWDGTAT